MSEINSIANGTFTIGQTSATNFIAGPGIQITEPSAGTVRIGTDETVLWSGVTNCISGSDSIVLNEPASGFEKLDFYITNNDRTTFNIKSIEATKAQFDLSNIEGLGSTGMAIRKTQCITNDYVNYTLTNFARMSFTNANSWNFAPYYGLAVTKVVGINRISGGNE